MEDLLAQQEVSISSIERALDNFKKVGKANFTIGIVRNRLQQLKDKFAQCEHLHGQILASASKEFLAKHEYITAARFSDCEATFLSTSDYMSEWMSNLETRPAASSDSSTVSQQSSNASSRSAFQLPRIALPKFSGDFRDWEAFRDQFTSIIIDSHDLSDVNRLQYLHSCVKDEASEVIRNLALTDANFKIAWQLLLSRYDNRRRLVHEHIHTLQTLPPASSDSAAALTALRDKANVAIQALKNLKCSVDTWDDILVYLVIQKFDKATRKAWELLLGDNAECPSYDQLDKFLLSRIRALESILPTSGSVKVGKQHTSVQSHSLNTRDSKCSMCQQKHLLYACAEFRGKAIAQRRELAKKYRCCFNCLSTQHGRDACINKNTCRLCRRKHHTLLHVEDHNNNSTAESSPSSTDNATEATPSVNSHLLSKASFSKANILLATAWIKVNGSNGRQSIVRALLDQGSVTTLITERLAQRLRLPRTRLSVSITGIGDTAAVAKSSARIQVSARNGTGPTQSINALVLHSLTRYVPLLVPDVSKTSYLNQIPLADSDPTSSHPIDVIIGADLYGAVMLSGIRKRAPSEFVAQNSIFGWILSGPMPVQPILHSAQIQTHHCSVLSEISEQLKRFWEIEELPQQQHLSPEETQCENHFASTHSRAPNGQYIVRFPFKTEPPLKLGDSKYSALALYSRLESKLKVRPDLAREYHEFLREYECLGYMVKVTSDDHSDNQIVHIPHHSVVRDNSATTHLRVVFNASHPTSNGLSLNDHLMIGPKLQTDLPSVITRWRQFQYVYTADIAKMYRQVLVDSRDVDYQRILWRSKAPDPISEYRLLTVTYGTACAPYLALRVLQQLAHDEGANFPLAVSILRQNTYVDDCIFGADDVPLAHRTREQVTALLQTAGFQLRKWASNSPALLEGIDPQDHGLATSKSLQTDEQIKILGIKWHPNTDTFQFDVKLESSAPETKRSMLSSIARIFDPLGWLAPIVITAKRIMQQLWLLRCKWDDVIPDSLLNQWRDYYAQLALLRQVSVSRWTGHGSDTLVAEVHGFSDASTSAYRAVIYLKVT